MAEGIFRIVDGQLALDIDSPWEWCERCGEMLTSGRGCRCERKGSS